MFHIDSGLFKLCFPSPHREVLFCYATISERLSCVRFPVYDLDCLLDSDSPPPAYLILPALFTDYPECLPPAPIQSLSSDSDSALPTLCLKLVIELCLSDLHTLLIKLHMDPNAPDSALQKTSPDIDPAVFYRFTTEVSAQATVLATKKQQLNHLTSLTEELVRSLRALHLPAPSMNASPQNPPTPAPASSDHTVTRTSSTGVAICFGLSMLRTQSANHLQVSLPSNAS